MFKKILQPLLSIGAIETDNEELKLKKSSLVLVPLIIGPVAFLWSMIYMYLGHYLSASIPFFYSIISVLNLLHLQKTKNIIVLQKVQMILVILLPFFLMWSLGGFASGSFVFIWAFYAPIASLTFEENRNSLYWFHFFMTLVLLSVILDPWLIQWHTSPMPQEAIGLFYFLNISAGLAGIYFLLRHFIREKDKNAHNLLEEEHKALLCTTQKLQGVNEKLNHFANYDSLTDLPNRYFFRENLKKMMALAKRQNHSIAVLFLDLDGFKTINDNYGHAIGDKILAMVAQRIKPLLREEDIVARIGGDEFAIAIGYITDKEFVNHISQRIIDEVNKSYDCIKNDDILGVSIGISCFPENATTIDSLINYADEAMYKVKEKGKNSFQIYKY